MNSEKDQGKKFSEEVDRLLAGQEPKVDQGADADLRSTLDFARKMADLRPNPTPEFKAQLEARLRQQFEAQEPKERATRGSSWFRRFIPRSPVWQAATALLVILLIFGITWSSGLFNRMGQTGAPAPSPSYGAVSTPAATTTAPATTTTVPAVTKPAAPTTTTAAATTAPPSTSAPAPTAPATTAPVTTEPPVTVTITAPAVTVTQTATPAARYFDPNSGLYFNTQQELQNYQNAHPAGSSAPAPATPSYIWVIIAVGAILVIIVIILIANARRI